VRALATGLIAASFLAWCCLTPLSGISKLEPPIDQPSLSDLEVEVVTWTRVDNPYPVSHYEVKAAVMMQGRVIEKSTVTDDHGKAFMPSLVWLGAKLNISIKPTSEMLDPRSHYYQELLRNQGVDYSDRSNESVKSLVPVEERRITLIVDKISPNLPFEVRVDYTAVTADVADALGRPLPGAWIALVDASTGLLTAWSYTNGSGHTSLMNVPVSDGELRQYFVEAYYLGEGLQGNPVWPFGAYDVWPCVYSSRLDERSNNSITVYGLRGKRLNITARVYHAQLQFFYEQRIPIDVSVTIHPKHLRVENIPATHGAININRIPRGLYGVTANWADITVGSGNINVTDTGGGFFVSKMNVDIYDLNLTVRDAADRHTVPDVECEIHDPLGRVIYVKAPDGSLMVQRLPKGYYTLMLSLFSAYTAERIEIARFMGNISYLASNTEIYTNTYDASLALKDGKGRPVSGATVTIGGASSPTNPMGEAVFNFVPAGRYQVTVSKAGVVLETMTISIDFSFRAFSFTLSNLLDLTIRVLDRESQPINSAIVVLRKGDEIVASASTDRQGLAIFTQTAVDSYTVEASYGQFSGKTLLTAQELQRSTPIEIRLPVSEGTSSTTQTTATGGGLSGEILIIVAMVVAASALIVLVASRRLRLTTVL